MPIIIGLKGGIPGIPGIIPPAYGFMSIAGLEGGIGGKAGGAASTVGVGEKTVSDVFADKGVAPGDLAELDPMLVVLILIGSLELRSGRTSDCPVFARTAFAAMAAADEVAL
jgi:hypothetical protein